MQIIYFKLYFFQKEVIVKKRILVIVDAQNDFINGVLGNKECEAAVPNIVKTIEKGYSRIITTQDTHDANYLETQEGRRLPILHRQRGTIGYAINSDIITALRQNGKKNHGVCIKKPTFGSVEVGKILKKFYEDLSRDGSEVEIHFTGFCTGICVISNVVIAKTFCPEARVCVIEDACACVTPETHETALKAMENLQVDIINSKDIE
jgi:nicotinamidase-related amidase